MHFDLDDDQLLLLRSARELLAAEWPRARLAQLIRGDGKDRSRLWRALRGAEYPGLLAPAAYDGSEADFLGAAVVLEAAGEALAPSHLDSPLLASHVLATAEHPGADEVLPAIASGELRISVGVGDGVCATRSGQSLRLDGVLRFVPEAAEAALLLLQVGDQRLVLVEADAPGVGVGEVSSLDPTRHFSDVHLCGVEVAPTEVVADGAQGRALVRDLFERACLAIAADAVGGGAAACSLATEYAREREQFGRPIGSFQAIKHKLAERAIAIEHARAATYYAAWAVDHGVPDRALAVRSAKVFATESYLAAAAVSLQVHGGIGFTREHPAHLYVQRAKLDELLLGSAARHRAAIAAAIRAEPGSAFA